MIPGKLENCPDCRNIKCTCPKQIGKRVNNKDQEVINGFEKEVIRVEGGLSDSVMEALGKFLLEQLKKREEEVRREIVERVKGRKVTLREERDHLPNVYKHLKGKNEAFDDVIAIIEERQNCIECGEIVGTNESVKNCHSLCRIEL